MTIVRTGARCAAAVLVLLALAAAPEVRAQALAAPRTAGGARDARFVLGIAWDFGGTKLIEVQMSDGSSQAIKANAGFTFLAGAAFAPLLDGRLETRATLGVKFDTIEASNGSANYLAFPLEVVESVNLEPFRLSAGLSLSMGPRLRGKGLLDAFDVDLKNSLGLVGEVVWASRAPGARAGWYGGARFLWQKLEADPSNGAVSANTLGLVAGVEF